MWMRRLYFGKIAIGFFQDFFSITKCENTPVYNCNDPISEDCGIPKNLHLKKYNIMHIHSESTGYNANKVSKLSKICQCESLNSTLPRPGISDHSVPDSKIWVRLRI